MVLQQTISVLTGAKTRGSFIPSFVHFKSRSYGYRSYGCSIRKNDKIHDIKIKNEEVKRSLFADDLICFLRNKSSYEHLISSLECFSKFSGLKLNEETTEFFRLGVHNLSGSFPHEFKLSVQILDVHFDCDELSRKNANFEANLKIYLKNIKYEEVERAHSYWENTNCQIIYHSKIFVVSLSYSCFE